jgi:hypothetical protein
MIKLSHYLGCRNPNFGLVTKARVCKRSGQERDRGMWEWTLTLSSELPCWKLESRWTPKFSESNCKGQNPLPWKVLYITGKLLKPRCPKWACMTHLDICNTSYDQKKGRESNWQFDSRPRKVKNRPDSLACMWCATHRWKDLDKGYNFGLGLIPIRGLHKKLWTRKVVEVTTLAISKVSGQNAIRMQLPWGAHGEV